MTVEADTFDLDVGGLELGVRMLSCREYLSVRRRAHEALSGTDEEMVERVFSVLAGCVLTVDGRPASAELLDPLLDRLTPAGLVRAVFDLLREQNRAEWERQQSGPRPLGSGAAAVNGAGVDGA